jgi:hypothetical protein
VNDRRLGSSQASPSTVADPYESHYRTVGRAVLDGRLTPFLGAGANLCGRSGAWGPEQRGRHLPSGAELARYLADEFDYPYEAREDLVRVSQYIATMDGPGPLFGKLHELFDADYPPSPLHEFLADLPRLLRDAGRESYQLLVTANYDDALERAFRAAGEPFDLVSYMAAGPHVGKFVHWHCSEDPDPDCVVIEEPDTYIDVSPEHRTVILKIHGLVDRTSAGSQWDSFVITEDHYIEYLTRTNLERLVPVNILNRFRRSNFLFLGYGMRDWNVRAMLHELWRGQQVSGLYCNWAVLLDPDEVDERSWRNRNVEIIEVPLDDYVARLGQHLRERLSAGAPT